MKIVTVEEMRRLEEACAREGITVDALMEGAGLAVALKAREALGDVAEAPILVLVGPGNNGGDGLVAARHLQSWSARVTAYLVTPRQPEDAKLHLARQQGMAATGADDDPSLSALEGELSRARMVIDAVLGTGRVRPLEGTLKEVMLKVGRSRAERNDVILLALDLPTGLDADTGQVDPATPQADITVTLGYPKVGHFQFPGASRLGKLEIVDIGIPEPLAQDIHRELLAAQWVREKLPPRPLEAHKGTFGRLLVVAGSRHYVGAAALAAEGAGRAGAGLVTLATPQSIYSILASRVREVTHLPLAEAKPGCVHPDSASLVKEALPQYDALLVGCGMGQSPEVREFLVRLLLTEPAQELPLLLDADGLNNLATVEGWWQGLKAPAVLTPHPGEMARLTGAPPGEIQARRIEATRDWAARWGKVVVLKGAFTVIASSQGTTMVSPFANPALASAGTGDVLAGAIAGLLAQGRPPFEAACCGVYLHGAAGERARQELGDAGVLAGDLLPLIPRVIRDLRLGGAPG